jgi:hypothetical protein
MSTEPVFKMLFDSNDFPNLDLKHKFGFIQQIKLMFTSLA